MQKLNTCIRFDKNTYNQIKEIAEKKRRKPTALIRLIVEDYLEKINL